MALFDIYQTRIVCQCQEQIGVNVLHYVVTATAGTGATPADIATAIDSAMEGDYKSILCSSANYIGVGVKKIFPIPPGAEATTRDNLGAGTVTGDLLPKQVAGVLSFKTTLAGRKQRGRLYFPFLSEASNTSAGVPSGGINGSLVTLGTDLLAFTGIGAGGNTSTIKLCIYHRGTHTYDVVDQVLTHGVWGTQRRRGDYGKTNLVPF